MSHSFSNEEFRMAYLTVVSGAMAGQRIDLEKPVTRIGRREGSDWIIQDGSVSGTHCEVEKTTTGFLLRDLGSTNGTAIGDTRVTGERALRHGDAILLGNTTVWFVDPGAATP
jgi:pSer/pThr/pTyr-binding forkhead associated (FHA) protein